LLCCPWSEWIRVRHGSMPSASHSKVRKAAVCRRILYCSLVWTMPVMLCEYIDSALLHSIALSLLHLIPYYQQQQASEASNGTQPHLLSEVLGPGQAAKFRNPKNVPTTLTSRLSHHK